MRRKTLSVLLLLLLVVLSCSCGKDKESRYETYVRSMLSTIYQGQDLESYCSSTGISKEDAEAAHQYAVQRLSDSLCRIYSLDLEGNDALKQKMLELSRSLYEKARFEVSPARKEEDGYYVDVTVSPMEFLSSTNEKLESYVQGYDSRVQAGEFNDVEKEEYQRQFASGVIEVLEDAAGSVVYADPVTLSVRIHESRNTYSVSDSDLKNIDAAIFVSSDQ